MKVTLAKCSSVRRSNDETVKPAPGGHSTAFETPSELDRAQLLRAAHRITRSREDAEDAVQNALVRAFVHIGDFEGRSNLRTWLTRITINSALMILRKKRVTPELAIGSHNDFGVDALRYEPTDHAPNPEKRYQHSEEQRILRTAIQRLRPNLQVVVHAQLQERSSRETAEAIGISLAAAKGRLFHAKKALRESLIRRFAARSSESQGNHRDSIRGR